MSDPHENHIHVDGDMLMQMPLSTDPSTPPPTVTKASILLEDADGGVTEIHLDGVKLRCELNPPKTIPRIGDLQWVRPGVKVGGTFAIRSIEESRFTYTPPEKPKKRWEVGQIVKLPAKFAPADFPYRNVGPVMKVGDVSWQTYSKCWQYHLQMRNLSNGLYVNDNGDDDLDKVELLDRWPLRAGDFVTFAGRLGMGQQATFKLLERVGEGEEDFSPETPRWWLANESGPTGTWIADKDAEIVDVTVVKHESWTRG